MNKTPSSSDTLPGDQRPFSAHNARTRHKEADEQIKQKHVNGSSQGSFVSLGMSARTLVVRRPVEEQVS